MSVVLASGSGAPSAGVITAHEQAQPEQTEMELNITLGNPRVLGVSVNIGNAVAAGAAAALNAAESLAHVPRWGAKTPLAEAQGPVLRIRWVKAAVSGGLILGALAGLGSLAAMVAAGWVELPAAIAVAAGGVAVIALAANWQLVARFLVNRVVKPTASLLLGPALLLGAVVIGGLVAVDWAKNL